MNPKELLIRDIATLYESIRLNYRDLSVLSLSQSEGLAIRRNTHLLIEELRELLKRLNPED